VGPNQSDRGPCLTIRPRPTTILVQGRARLPDREFRIGRAPFPNKQIFVDGLSSATRRSETAIADRIWRADPRRCCKFRRRKIPGGETFVAQSLFTAVYRELARSPYPEGDLTAGDKISTWEDQRF